MFAVLLTLLCLMSVGHSAPQACEELVKPLDHPELPNFIGKWAMVAGSLNNSDAARDLNSTDSVTVDIRYSSYIIARRFDGLCQNRSENFQEEDLLKLKGENFNITGTLLNTSCSDCLVITLKVDRHNYQSLNVYFLSKRRELEQKEMEEFRAQVKCLNMPPPIVMDPTKKLCPTETIAQPQGKPGGQED